MADTMTDDLRDRIAAALLQLTPSLAASVDLVLGVVRAAITEARREGWEVGWQDATDNAPSGTYFEEHPNPYAAGEHDTPAGEPLPPCTCGRIFGHEHRDDCAERRYAQNPVTPMVVGADGRTPLDRLTDDLRPDTREAIEARARGPEHEEITGTIPGVTGYTIAELRAIWQSMLDGSVHPIREQRLACMAAGLANQLAKHQPASSGDTGTAAIVHPWREDDAYPGMCAETLDNGEPCPYKRTLHPTGSGHAEHELGCTGRHMADGTRDCITTSSGQTAEHGIDTAAVRAKYDTDPGDFFRPVWRTIRALCDALDRQGEETARLREEISTRRYFAHEACDRAYWDGIRKWRDEAANQLKKRDDARARLDEIRALCDDEDEASDGNAPSILDVANVRAILDRATEAAS